MRIKKEQHAKQDATTKALNRKISRKLSRTLSKDSREKDEYFKAGADDVDSGESSESSQSYKGPGTLPPASNLNVCRSAASPQALVVHSCSRAPMLFCMLWMA